MKKSLFCFIAAFIIAVYASAADFTLKKTFEPGVPTPLCLPFEINTSHFDAIYEIGAIQGSNAIIYPVNSVEAGTPCVVVADLSRTTTLFHDVDVNTNSLFTMPLIWDGGTCRGDFSNYTWSYTTIRGNVGIASQLHFQICDINNMEFEANLENLYARQFITNTYYDLAAASKIKLYMPDVFERRDLPNPVAIPLPDNTAEYMTVTVAQNDDYSNPVAVVNAKTSDKLCNVFNLIPQQQYFYKVEAEGTVVSKGKFNTIGHLRMIAAPSVSNIRDLGGWNTVDGKRTAYGKLFRGGELNGQHVASQEDIQLLKNLGINAEIDLRWSQRPEENVQVSAYGFSEEEGTFYYVDGDDWSGSHYDTEATKQHLTREINMIIATLRKGQALYYHCVWGADRTGFISMTLEALMGVVPDEIFKDYELTSFSIAGLRSKDTFADRLNYFNKYPGATLKDRCEYYFVNVLGISQEDIDFFQNEMTED